MFCHTELECISKTYPKREEGHLPSLNSTCTIPPCYQSQILTLPSSYMDWLTLGCYNSYSWPFPTHKFVSEPHLAVTHKHLAAPLPFSGLTLHTMTQLRYTCFWVWLQGSYEHESAQREERIHKEKAWKATTNIWNKLQIEVRNLWLQRLSACYYAVSLISFLQTYIRKPGTDNVFINREEVLFSKLGYVKK